MKTYLIMPLLLGCLSNPGLVYAQAPKELTAEDMKRLAAMVDNADKQFSAKKYEEALPIYQDIYNQTNEPTMLYRIALCYQNLEKHQEAVDSYQKFLDQSPEESEFRTKAKESIEIERAKIPAKGTDPEPKTPKTPKKKSVFLFGGAGAAGAAGVAVGFLSLRASSAAKDAQDAGDTGIAALQKKANSLALISDAAIVAAVGLGVGGLLLSKKEKETITLLVGPTNVALSVEF